MEKITLAEWQRAKRNNNGVLWDGRPHIKYVELVTGKVTWRPVEIQFPTIKRRRRWD